MTNHQTKSEDPWAMSSLQTEVLTDKPTCEKQYTLTSSEGGIIKLMIFLKITYRVLL